MSGLGASGQETVTQESLLLAALERIARIRDGRIAVHLHLSLLKPQNRQEGHLRIALRMLEPVVGAYRGQMFLLSDSDIVFLLKDPNVTDVENMVFKVRALFSKDPLTFNDRGDGVDRFCTWFDLETADYTRFLEFARERDSEARQKGREKSEEPPPLAPLRPKDLEMVIATLRQIDVAALIRRQSAIMITDRGTAEVCYQEFFVAMAELQKAVGGQINLLANRWLFQHLSLTLDELVLDTLGGTPFQTVPNVFSLNLNLTTVPSESFARFQKRIGGRSGISVELQVLDILADSGAYFKIRDQLREAGHKVVIDGLDALTMKFMDLAQFGGDFHKLSWNPDMREVDRGVLAGLTIPRESLILARCDSEAAIQWGLDRGIARFQGRYVDAMLAAYTKAGCAEGRDRSLQEWIAGRSVIGGPLRARCGNSAALDASPEMRAPKVHRSEEGPS